MSSALLVLCLALAPPPGALVVATYNLENYGPADRRTDHGFERDYPKPEAEKAAARRVIAGLGADILALQEMGPEGTLEELRRDLRSEGTDYGFAATTEAEDGRRRLALLAKTRLRPVSARPAPGFAYLGGRESVKRGILEAVAETPAGDLRIFVLHLKSHLTERPDDPEGAVRRLAEAAAVRDRILEEFSDPARGRFIVLGDCNDGSHSATLRRLERRGTLVVALRLPAADRRGETWTEAWWRGDRYSELDHILVSPALAGCAEGGIAHVYDGDAVGLASDHRPVFVRLALISR